jgi:hypothetical protein
MNLSGKLCALGGLHSVPCTGGWVCSRADLHAMEKRKNILPYRNRTLSFSSYPIHYTDN